MMQITLNISEEVYQRHQWLACFTGRSFDDVLNDSLVYPLPALNPIAYKPVETLADAEVIALAELQMSEEQGERLGELQYRQRESMLTDEERPELWALFQVYQLGLMRKAQGIREAVERGLMPRLDNVVKEPDWSETGLPLEDLHNPDVSMEFWLKYPPKLFIQATIHELKNFSSSIRNEVRFLYDDETLPSELREMLKAADKPQHEVLKAVLKYESVIQNILTIILNYAKLRLHNQYAQP